MFRNIINYLTKINFSKGRSQPIRYIVIHYTSNNGDTAMNNAKYFETVNRGASAHLFVDEIETVRVVKDEDTAWHCGAQTYVHTDCRNSNSIGIEMCSRKYANGTYYFKQEVINATVELTQILMKQYNIPIENVIRHKDVTGKNCPAPYSDNNEWNKFKNLVKNTSTGSVTSGEVYKVRKTWADIVSQKGSFSVLENAKKCADENPGYNVYNSKGGLVYPIQAPLPTQPVGSNEEIIWNFFKNNGFNNFAISGILGNIFAESACSSINLQDSFEKKLGYTDDTYTRAVDSGQYTREQFGRDSSGYGLVQHTYYTRKFGLYDYAKSTNRSIGDTNMQLEYIYKELTTDYKQLVEKLKTAKSVLEASNYFLFEFEKPADQSIAVQTKRAEYGQKYYDQYANKVTPKPQPIGTGDNPSQWAKEATQWAKSQGLFNGDGNGNYDWQGSMTREMMAVVLSVFYNKIKK